MTKPTVEELTIHFDTQLKNWEQSKEEAERFFNHYSSNGWLVGKNPMKQWRYAVMNWIKNINAFNAKKEQAPTDRRFFTKEEAQSRK